MRNMGYVKPEEMVETCCRRVSRKHAIVNMFVIPAGMWLGADIILADWWLWNGLPVIAGNLLGGMMFTGVMLY